MYPINKQRGKNWGNQKELLILKSRPYAGMQELLHAPLILEVALAFDISTVVVWKLLIHLFVIKVYFECAILRRMPKGDVLKCNYVLVFFF